MSGTAFAKDIVPDWVRDAAAEKLPSYPADTNGVILLDDITYTVGADGKAVEHEMVVMRILRPQGRDLGIVHVDFNKDSKLNYLHVWSIGPDGHEYTVKDSDMAIIGSYNGSDLYDDLVSKAANAPARDPGAVIAYEYEQHEPYYLNEDTESIQIGMPVHRLKYTLRLPENYTYRTVWMNHDPVEPSSAGANQFQWQFSDLPAINLHDLPLAPSASSLYSRFTVHYYPTGATLATKGDWVTEGEMVARLNSDRYTATPEITAKAKELTAGKTDFFDKAMAIGQYVQKFRYYNIELGIGGLQPHFAGDIFKNHYGDCKDKATVLASMLSAVGIHAVGVIVDVRRGVIAPTNPSQIGNHEITAIEIPAGYTSPKMHSVVTTKFGKRYLIFDPTWPYIPFGDIEYNLQDSYGLISDGADSDLVKIPVLSPEESHVAHNGSFKIGTDHNLSGSVSSSYFGDISEDWRNLLIEETADKKRDAVQGWLAEFLPNSTLADYTSSNIDQMNQDMLLKIDFTAQGYARAMGPLLLVRPCVVGAIRYHLDSKSRKYPIDLGDAHVINDDFTIELPDGYAVDDVPEPVKVDTGFASYESKTVIQGHTLHYTRKFEMRVVELPANKYDDLRKLMETINNDERSEVVLKKAS